MEKSKVDLMNTEAVRDYIAEHNWTPGRRANIIYAYALFAKWAGLPFTLPRINIPGKLPFIPTEREIDDLIAACTKYIATFLQLGKETGARAGEIGSLRWTDIDFENCTLRVTAEKGSNPRVCKLSNKAIQMLNQLPRKHPTIFIGQYKNVINLRSTYCKQRKRVAAKMGNPRLLQIHFHTLRH
jgi:integrase